MLCRLFVPPKNLWRQKMYDPIVEEVRSCRDNHARKFNYDLNAICNDYRLKHKIYVNRLIQINADSNRDRNAPRGASLPHH